VSSYSFLDVQAAITGPGGIVSFGYGSAVAEEGITFEFEADKGTVTTGCDGTVMHNLHAGQTGTITVRLLKTSPQNSLLNVMLDLQRVSSALWGTNTISIRNVNSGDTLLGVSMAFVKFPNNVSANDGGNNEWAWKGRLEPLLGNWQSQATSS